MVEVRMEARPSALQEFPDTAILAGHSRPKRQELKEEIALTLSWGICPQNPRT